jgi:hypothetical protein
LPTNGYAYVHEAFQCVITVEDEYGAKVFHASTYSDANFTHAHISVAAFGLNYPDTSTKTG